MKIVRLHVLSSTANYIIDASEAPVSDRRAIDAFIANNNLSNPKIIKEIDGCEIDTILGSWGCCVELECKIKTMKNIAFTNNYFEDSSITVMDNLGRLTEMPLMFMSKYELNHLLAMNEEIVAIDAPEEIIKDFKLYGSLDMYYDVKDLVNEDKVPFSDADLMFSYCKEILGVEVTHENLEEMAKKSYENWCGWYLSVAHYREDTGDVTGDDDDFEEFNGHLFYKN